MTLIEGAQLPTLTSQRLHLRWLTDDDAPALFAVFSDPKAMRYWSTPPWATLAESTAYIAGIHRSFAAQSLFQWGIVRTDDGDVIGTCTLAQIDVANRRAEIGFMLRPNCWGKGFMTEAVAALLEFSFKILKLHRIEADVDPRNAASIRLLERFGFKREGYLRERWFVGEEVNDGVFYGLLHHEYSSPPSIH
ncbi:MAG: GNAT family N-acetyltransferase [Phycisphaerales bacterium]|nr:GNAT family N-acetyltransferase [Phycisphaerales bacterium]MCB9862670.1 GNAT family N-acetyltransferase [Phycisphaerales bacterium]